MNYTRNEYPRPQFKRNTWQNLNGVWEFCFDDEDCGIEKKYYEKSTPLSGKINVPFTYQSKASGIGSSEQHEVMWYRRDFILDEQMCGERVLLNFNAVDYRADVWLNGQFVGTHTNGYTHFYFDITRFLKKINTLAVRVVDSYDTAQPRGKQFWKLEPSRCWYVASSGIWQSVWLEKVGAGNIDYALITPDIDTNTVDISLSGCGKFDAVRITVSYKGETVRTQTADLKTNDEKLSVCIREEDYIDEVHYWSLDNPNIYDLKLELSCNGVVTDTVQTYFAFRKISVLKDKILLNNSPLYQKLILDQGYWADTDITPPSAESLKEDILAAKAMGFNGARKHQKIEDPYFYYYADMLGFLVWGEMPSAYNYGLREVNLHSAQYIELIRQLYNHPSVIIWVPLNESWGVRKLLSDVKQKSYARALYYLTKSIDSTRLVSTNDGWECVEETDFISIHDYAPDSSEWKGKYGKENLNDVYPMSRRLMGFGENYNGQKPVIMTEYGGIALKLNSVKCLGKEADGENWGYVVDSNCEDFLKRYNNLNEGVFSCDFAGFCYTQLTDVKQEVNGLLDANHKPKFDNKRLAKINDAKTFK